MRSIGTLCFLGLLLVGTFTANASAKEKERAWQTGKLLDTNESRVYAGTVGSASGSATSDGNTSYGQANGSSTAVYRVYETYTIESGDFIYVCREHIKWRWSKPAVATVNGPVQFAIEKNHLYIKSEDGSEHETTILKTVSKPPQPDSPNVQQQQPATEPTPSTHSPEKGSITVDSTPGADVYVDGSFVGNAPAVLKLTEGKHTIKVSMTGYADWTRNISVLGGSDVTLTAALVKPN
jgi:hypothetical protein